MDSSAANIVVVVVVARELLGTAADMTVVTTVGEEIGRTGVSAVHGVLGTAGTIAEHKEPRRLVALLHVVDAYDVGPRTLSPPEG